MQKENGEVRRILAHWQKTAAEIRFIDSSHGEDDVRENYILDDRWVLRVNSAPVMSDGRLADLNRLILRYRAFGLAAPLFIPLDETGRFTLRLADGGTAYLSEYLNLPTPPQRLPGDWYEKKLVPMVAAFAQRYRGVDVSGTYSMYSLFDLSPYDQPNGMDEKQENCLLLISDLRQAGEEALAGEIERLNDELRQRLRALYPALPRCVFQGDENRTNFCLDEQGELAGIFDFNMAGADVCVNYLANQVMFLLDLGAETVAAGPAEAVLARMQAAEDRCLRVVREHYAFTPEEEAAYPLCQAIVRLFHWNNVCDYREGLKSPSGRQNAAALLRLAAADIRRSLQ